MSLNKYSVQSILKENFETRLEKNSLYSIRAYARDLEISSGALSEIMRGKRKISKKLAEKIVNILDLNEETRKIVQFEVNYGKSLANIVYDEVDLTAPKEIDSWYYFALLSLLKLDDFKSDTQYIADRLEITEPMAKKLVSDLLYKGIIRRNSNNKLVRTSERISTSDGVLSKPVQKMHEKNLDLAKESLSKVDISLRDFSTMTMAIDIDRFPEAINIIRDFEDRLSCFLEGGKKNEVYNLCIQLYPLTNVSGNKIKKIN